MGVRLGVVGGHQLGADGVRGLGGAWPGDCTAIDVAGPGADPLTLPPDLDKMLGGYDLVLVDLGPGWRTLAYRVARRCADLSVLAFFLQRDGTRVQLIPQRPRAGSPCYLCFTLRHLACRDDLLDALVSDARDEPASVDVADADLGEHAIRVARRLARWIARQSWTVPLWEKMVEIDLLADVDRSHWFAAHPSCPQCGSSAGKSVDAGAVRRRSSGDLQRLISPVCGIVRDVSGELFAGAHLAFARPSNPRLAVSGFLQSGVGCAIDAADAQMAAVGEAVERYALAVWEPDPAVVQDIPPGAITFKAEQLTGSPYADGGADHDAGYLQVSSLLHETPCYVPAPLAGAAPVPARWPQLNPSNGVAAHTSRAAAISRAIAELVERDAFLLTWLARLPVEGYLARSHPDPAVLATLAELARTGVTVHLYRLPAAIGGHVFLSVALMDEWDRHAPHVTVGLGCHLDPIAAAAKAVLESVLVWRELSRRLATRAIREFAVTELADARNLTLPGHHALHYATRADLTALDFLLRQPAIHRLDAMPATPDQPVRADTAWERILASAGFDVLCVDITPAHLATTGWHVCRLIVPGSIPHVTSNGFVPHGLPRLQSALASGCDAAGLPRDRPNPNPHPLA